MTDRWPQSGLVVPLKDQDVERAHARYLLGRQKQADREASGDQTPLLTVCQTYTVRGLN